MRTPHIYLLCGFWTYVPTYRGVNGWTRHPDQQRASQKELDAKVAAWCIDRNAKEGRTLGVELEKM